MIPRRALDYVRAAPCREVDVRSIIVVWWVRKKMWSVGLGHPAEFACMFGGFGIMLNT
jgi:hypothetical protein